jgi:hypothetical protein
VRRARRDDVDDPIDDGTVLAAIAEGGRHAVRC